MENCNLTISPFGYSVTKSLKQTLDLKCEFENKDKTYSHLNLNNNKNLKKNLGDQINF